MQGYFQTAAFHLPSPDTSTPPASDAHTTALDPNDLITIRYTIISRRSKERAGLRYQRRGIDDSADVANFVETETVAQLKVGIEPPVVWKDQMTDETVISSGKVPGICSVMYRSEDQVSCSMFRDFWEVQLSHFTSC